MKKMIIAAIAGAFVAIGAALVPAMTAGAAPSPVVPVLSPSPLDPPERIDLTKSPCPITIC